MRFRFRIGSILLAMGCMLFYGCGNGGGTGGNSGQNPPVSLSPTTASVMPGDAAVYTVQIQPDNPLIGAVGLTILNLPAGASADFSPPQVTFSSGDRTRTSTLTITTDAALPTGIYDFIVEGRFNTVLVGTTQGSLNVQTQGGPTGFTLAVTPQSSVVTPTVPASFTITVTPTGGFAGDVSLSVSGGSADIAVGNPTPGVVNVVSTTPVTSTLQVGLAPGATGTLSVPLTITATSGTMIQTANITVQPQP